MKKKIVVKRQVPSLIKGTLLLVTVLDSEKCWEKEPNAGSALTPRPTTKPSSYHPRVLRIESPKKEVLGVSWQKTLRDTVLLLALSTDASLPVCGHVTRRA